MTDNDPTDEELAQAYRENAEQTRELNDEWRNVSREATQHLGDESTSD